MSHVDSAGTRLRRLVVFLAVAAVSLLLGGLTSFAQGLLPGPLAPVANSSSGWAFVTALIVWLTRARAWRAAVFGAVSFVALIAGYTVAAQLRGFTYDPLFWCVIGVLAGPFVGTAASWLCDGGLRAALGSGLLAGIGIGDCVYGLTTVAATTGSFYWALSGAVGVALLALTFTRRVDRLGHMVCGLCTACSVAAVLFGLLHSL